MQEEELMQVQSEQGDSEMQLYSDQMKTASFNSAKWCPRSLVSHSYLLP